MSRVLRRITQEVLLRSAAPRAHDLLRRLAAPALNAPTAKTVLSFVETWPTLSVDARRDVAAALLTAVRVNPDKTVEIAPRWGETVHVPFTRRNTIPLPIVAVGSRQK